MRAIAISYLGIMCLLALTVGSSFVELGLINPVLNLAIAVAKAAVIAAVFMHLASSEPLPRLAVGAAVLWLAILFVLTLVS